MFMCNFGIRVHKHQFFLNNNNNNKITHRALTDDGLPTSSTDGFLE